MQGKAEQVSKSSNKVHQTMYKPLFSTLYMSAIEVERFQKISNR